MKILSVVCARAGSKGLRNKSVIKANGKMIVEYSIEYSLSLGNNVKTVISTDIEELIDYCIKNNITYIRRDSKLCTDENRIDDALVDAILKEGREHQYCSLVYGNIPTRYPALFYKAINFLKEDDTYEAVISVQDVGKFHPEWMFDYNADLVPKVKENSYRRQALSPKMIHDGHTFIFKIGAFLNRYNGLLSYDDSLYSIFGNRIKPLINDEPIVDIDTEKDLKIAIAILSGKLGK